MITPASYVELTTNSEILQAQFQQSFSGRDVVKINDMEFVCTSHNRDKTYGLQEFRRVTLIKPKSAPGECLPPVGTVVRIDKSDRIIWDVAEMFIGVDVTVVAVFKTGDTDMVAVELASEGQCCCFRADMVRIQTAEQIAAEERSKSVSDIIRAIGWIHGVPGAEDAAGRIYDAGFRKEVAK